MKLIFSIFFSFLILFLAPTLANANEVCPNDEQEWPAIKYRAFHMKLFQVATRCNPHRYENNQRVHTTPNGPRVDEASMKLSGDCAFRAFHVDQMRIASEYFDRRYPSAGRGDTYSTSGECRRTTPLARGNRNTRYNLEWESYETDILNKISLQISNTQATPAAWQNYCEQANAAINQVLEAESPEDIMEIVNEHPFASEHDLPQCDDGNGAVSTSAISADDSPADTAADTADTDAGSDSAADAAPPPPPPPPPPAHTDVQITNSGAARSSATIGGTDPGDTEELAGGPPRGPTMLLPPISLADYAREQGTTVADSVMLNRLVMPGPDGRCRPDQRTILFNGTSNIRCIGPQQNP